MTVAPADLAPPPDRVRGAEAARPGGFRLKVPDVASPRAFALLAGLVVLAGALVWGRDALFTRDFADTDDALRAVIVRDLLGGQPWFDLVVHRLQPPAGLGMHWSRLVDGALALPMLLLAPLLGAAGAETLVRTLWPLLWLAPASLAAFAAARALGGAKAPALCALALVTSPAAFIQFVPGRIDHHDLQIAAVLLTLAGVLRLDRGRGAGWLAGVATAVGLAVGLECVLFLAALAAAAALRFVADPGLGPALRRYAAGLATATLGAFAVQTPPALWLAPACDALGSNLVLGVLVGAAGLVAAVSIDARVRLGVPGRLGLVLAAGALALGLALAVDPACRGGPFATLDPRVRALWLDNVSEVQPLAVVFGRSVADAALFAFGPAAALAALLAALTFAPALRRDPRWLTVFALVALAAALTFEQAKGAPYAAWIGAVALSAALARLLPLWRSLLVPSLGAVLALSPLGASRVAALVAPDKAGAPEAKCQAPADFAALGGLPPGLVLADIDLGPAILAFTPHSALSAPYHRMGAAILEAHDIVAAPPGEALGRLRARGVAYVATCGPGAPAGASAAAGPDGLGPRLGRGEAVPGLEAVPGAGPLRVWRVLPPAAAADGTPAA